MFFKNLESKCLYYRGLTDYKILPNTPVIVMLDGRSFSQFIKHKFKLPFDNDFIDMMNKTAEYLCQKIQGCKLAYVQSDEISLLLTDYDTPKSDLFFSGRLCKMQSIIASLATARFNQLMFLYELKTGGYDWCKFDAMGVLYNLKDAYEMIEKHALYQFDCKVWPVPSANDAYAWFLYRQLDCTKNSKQQVAQTYVPHKKLLNHTTDEQVEITKADAGIDWNTDFPDGMKYGRFIYKEDVQMSNEITIKGETKKVEFVRNVWTSHPAFPLTDAKDRFYEIVPILKEK